MYVSHNWARNAALAGAPDRGPRCRAGVHIGEPRGELLDLADDRLLVLGCHLVVDERRRLRVARRARASACSAARGVHARQPLSQRLRGVAPRVSRRPRVHAAALLAQGRDKSCSCDQSHRKRWGDVPHHWQRASAACALVVALVARAFERSTADSWRLAPWGCGAAAARGRRTVLSQSIL